MGEGGLESPARHVIPWRDAGYTDQDTVDAEMRRVFDICHGCRRCFNLCDSFPRLFDLIDNSDTGELDSVESADFQEVTDACTLCDMCFMTKCPYVPPHEFNLDFPHLMLRYRALKFEQGKVGIVHRQLSETDRNGKLAGMAAPVINWCSKRTNGLTRFLLEMVAGVHRDAELPKYYRKTFNKIFAAKPKSDARTSSRKAVIYTTCFINFNNPAIGEAAEKVLSKNGVDVEVAYPSCCGMPQLEQGNIGRVADDAKKIAVELVPWVDKGYDIITLVPSCALMLKSEWPLILPEDKKIRKISEATFDISEYLINISRHEGLTDGMASIEGGVTVHLACHARAQNMGPKTVELLRLIPNTDVTVVERCSGHGGLWGIKKENFGTALKQGRLAARKALEANSVIVVSECPLARDHIIQGIEQIDKANLLSNLVEVHHPIQVVSMAYGL